MKSFANGVVLPDGRKLTWYGNRRSRTIEVEELKWVGFETNLTLENYTNVLSGKEIKFKDANGAEIIDKGKGLGDAFLNFNCLLLYRQP